MHVWNKRGRGELTGDYAVRVSLCVCALFRSLSPGGPVEQGGPFVGPREWWRGRASLSAVLIPSSRRLHLFNGFLSSGFRLCREGWIFHLFQPVELGFARGLGDTGNSAPLSPRLSRYAHTKRPMTSRQPTNARFQLDYVKKIFTKT